MKKSKTNIICRKLIFLYYKAKSMLCSVESRSSVFRTPVSRFQKRRKRSSLPLICRWLVHLYFKESTFMSSTQFTKFNMHFLGSLLLKTKHSPILCLTFMHLCLNVNISLYACIPPGGGDFSEFFYFPSPQYIVLVWWYNSPHVIILFKIIHFYLKKISETNTSQVQNHGYSTDAFGSQSFHLNFAIGRLIKMTAKLGWKVTAASLVQERLQEVICPEIMEMGILQIISFHWTP